MRLSPQKRSAAIQLGLVLAAIAGPLLVWFPYRRDMSAVYRFWDGPAYLTIARDLYRVTPGDPLAPNPAAPPYYLCQFPGYPLLTRALSFVGYPRALLLAVLLSTIAAVLLFYRLARDVWKVRSPGFLSLVFLYLPPRWLLYRSVSASEPLFLALVLACLWYFERAEDARASLFGALATLTRLPGVLLFPPLVVLHVMRRRNRTVYWLALIPAALGAYLLFSQVRFHDAFAPLEPNFDRVTSLVPLAWIERADSWPSHSSGEFYLIAVLAYAVGTMRLRRRHPTVFGYAAAQLLLFVFLSDGDWSRYALSLAPFALILGFEDVIDTRAFRWIFPVIAVCSIRWASIGIRYNMCDPITYGKILAHLGLTPR